MTTHDIIKKMNNPRECKSVEHTLEGKLFRIIADGYTIELLEAGFTDDEIHNRFTGTIDAIKAIKSEETKQFDLVHRMDDLPPDQGEGYSESVLIDLTGEKKLWDIGWYDHDEKKWMLQSDNEIDFKHAVWHYLPH